MTGPRYGASIGSLGMGILVLCTLACQPVLAQVGHPPSNSPFRDIRKGHTLTATGGYFGGSGRYAGQMTFPNAIGIDTRGNVYVGEVDMGKRIQKFAPVLSGAR